MRNRIHNLKSITQNPKYRIGIDARFYGVKDKGLGRYTENLIRNLEKLHVNYDAHSSELDANIEFIIFLRKERWDDYQPKNINFKKVLCGKFKKYKLDLIHFTYFRIPVFYRGKFIVTIHDLISSHVCFLKRIVYKIILKSALKRAEKIIAVSEYTKRDILKKYPAKDGAIVVNPDKIKVIYEGVTRKQKIKDKIEKTQIKYKKPYILYVGNAYPHKNLERLILAFERLDPGYKLVLVTSKKQFKHFNQVPMKSRRSTIKHVIFTGFVSDKELDRLYKNASLYVFPSLYEGFGLPPLEAMTRGVPVASSSATCLPEILGDAVIYFNPLDINDMAKKIKKALLNKDIRRTLIRKGFEQVRRYSWEGMAEETLSLYKSI